MIYYVVKKGDTLSSIARKYHVSVVTLIEDNQISNPDNLTVGQCLLIKHGKNIYIVEKGDNLGSIAIKNGISINDILLANPNLNPPYTIIPGQVIYLVPSQKNKSTIKVNGYVYNNTSLETIEKSLPYLTMLSIFSYRLKDDGHLIDNDEQDIIDLAKKYKVAPIMVVTNTLEKGSFNSKLASNILNNEQYQDNLINDIIQTMNKKGYKGINIDFEYIYPDDKDAYAKFIKKLASQVKEAGNYLVSLALAPKYSADQKGLLYESHDYKTLSKLVDYVIIMTYEWGYTFGPAMAVAPINLVDRVIKYAVSEISPASILLGVPNYGYDFTLPYDKNVPAKSIANVNAPSYAYSKKAEIQYDEDSQTPYFSYYDENKKRHIVYFEDARSIKSKCALVDEFNLGGISIWTIATYFNVMYEVISYYFNIEKII